MLHFFGQNRKPIGQCRALYVSFVIHLNSRSFLSSGALPGPSPLAQKELPAASGESS